ncbi:MAG: PIN domain-containing protein [Bifidobacteriaceae bacterium]|jgi:toxin-antitoxin system PIN domain toxin|nr:PIN domain-containing protein [Bifidobacteriaceae bacterium]
MSVLLDANVLIALRVPSHEFHQAAIAWFNSLNGSFATCPSVQGSLIRFAIRAGTTATEALELLAGITSKPNHEFWPDELPYGSVEVRGVIGHRQVTDAYLAQLARLHGSQLATFDKGLAAQHPDVAWLLGATQ